MHVLSFIFSISFSILIIFRATNSSISLKYDRLLSHFQIGVQGSFDGFLAWIMYWQLDGTSHRNRRVDFPFFTDDDFGGKFNFVLDQDPWGADDDTDIEYIYQLAMEQNNSPLLNEVRSVQHGKNTLGYPYFGYQIWRLYSKCKTVPYPPTPLI